jgi:hypothetical protein
MDSVMDKIQTVLRKYPNIQRLAQKVTLDELIAKYPFVREVASKLLKNTDGVLDRVVDYFETQIDEHMAHEIAKHDTLIDPAVFDDVDVLSDFDDIVKQFGGAVKGSNSPKPNLVSHSDIRSIWEATDNQTRGFIYLMVCEIICVIIIMYKYHMERTTVMRIIPQLRRIIRRLHNQLIRELRQITNDQEDVQEYRRLANTLPSHHREVWLRRLVLLIVPRHPQSRIPFMWRDDNDGNTDRIPTMRYPDNPDDPSSYPRRHSMSQLSQERPRLRRIMSYQNQSTRLREHPVPIRGMGEFIGLDFVLDPDTQQYSMQAYRDYPNRIRRQTHMQ